MRGYTVLLNARALKPGGSARPGRENECFTATRIIYWVHRYGIRSRYDRLRAQGLLTAKEMAARLGIHYATLITWAKNGLVTRHAYDGHRYLYEEPPPDLPAKQRSRWNRVVDRVAAMQVAKTGSQDVPLQVKEM